MTSNLSPTDSDRLKWWSRFAHFTIVIKALVPTGNIYWVCGKARKVARGQPTNKLNFIPSGMGSLRV